MPVEVSSSVASWGSSSSPSSDDVPRNRSPEHELEGADVAADRRPAAHNGLRSEADGRGDPCDDPCLPERRFLRRAPSRNSPCCATHCASRRAEAPATGPIVSGPKVCTLTSNVGPVVPRYTVGQHGKFVCDGLSKASGHEHRSQRPQIVAMAARKRRNTCRAAHRLTC